MTAKTLAEAVHLAPRFARSIRVETDLLAGAALDGFVCSASVAALLSGLARQYAGGEQRAFTITGTYGAGKSSLAVALSCLIGRDAAARATARAVLGADLAGEVSAALGVREGYQVVPVVGHRADPEMAIGAALEAVCGRRKRRQAPTSLATRLVEAASGPGSNGLLLVVDEMGKLLEAAAAGDGDVQVFQEIAEAAARSGGRLIVVGLLHSAFEDYGGRLGSAARREWAKVQGRFVDLPLSIGLEEQIDILARAVVADRRPSSNEGRAGVVAAEVARARPEAASALTARLHGCWPLEPLAAVSLSALARRGLGQAQRSLFAFLSSAEPRGFRDALAALPADAERAYLAADLWDYVAANRGVAALGAADGPRLALGLDALDRCAARGGGPEHAALLKTVALLDLLRETAQCRATRAVLAASLPADAAERLDALLADLVAWSVLVHRRHLDAYALFAGSDVDVGVLVTAAREQLAGAGLERLSSLAALPPLVAKRHHEETGALRWFPVEITALSNAAHRVEATSVARKDGASGTFLLTLPLAGERRPAAQKAWRAAASRTTATPVAIGLARDGYRVREAAEELLAVEAVRCDTPELAGDAAARREVAARHDAAAAELEAVLRDAVSSADWLATVPGTSTPADLAGGSAAALTAAASHLADLAYPQSPRLRSDLLNRAELSSNAAAARRLLLYAMVEHGSRPNLGLSGFPPERGLHVALLERTGLHRPAADGTDIWVFGEPSDADPARLRPLWDAADRLLHGGEPGVTVASLHALWAAPPFGTRAGLLPVLATAYVLSRRDCVALSLDGVFAPAPSTFLVDRMMQDSCAVGLRWSEDEGVRNTWLSALADAFGTAGILVSGEEGRPRKPLEVASAVHAFVSGLAPWALRTNRVGSLAQRLRVAIRNAKDPLTLLLDEVPAMLGGTLGTPEEANHLAGAFADEMRVLGDAYPRLLADVTLTIEREFRVGEEGGLAGLQERSRVVRGLTGDLRLDALAVHLGGYEGAPEQVEAVAALAAHKPMRDWTDRDVDAALLGLAELAQRFLRAEAMAHVRGRADTAEAIAVVSSDPATGETLVSEVRLPRAAEAEAAALLAGIEELIGRNGAGPEAQVAALVRVLAARVAATQAVANTTVRRKAQ